MYHEQIDSGSDVERTIVSFNYTPTHLDLQIFNDADNDCYPPLKKTNPYEYRSHNNKALLERKRQILFEKTKKRWGELQTLGHIDVSDVLHTIENSPGLWEVNKDRQKTFVVHEHTKSIVLIWDKNRDEGLLKLFKHFLDEIENKLNDHFKYQNPKINKLMIVKLPTKSNVMSHTDIGLDLRCVHRIHVPIKTNQKVETTINYKQFYMEKGNIYSFNNTLEHGIQNNSSEDRIHFILDYQDEADALSQEVNDFMELQRKH